MIIQLSLSKKTFISLKIENKDFEQFGNALGQLGALKTLNVEANE